MAYMFITDSEPGKYVSRPDVSSRLSTGVGLQCIPIHPPLGLPRVYEVGLICCCAMVAPWGIGLSKEGKGIVAREGSIGKPLS